MSDFFEMLKKITPNIQKNIELAPFTTWKIGGAAAYFWEPDEELLPDVLTFCSSNDIPVWYIGRGSNILIDSKGLNGLVICTKKALQKIKLENDIITVGAGVP